MKETLTKKTSTSSVTGNSDNNEEHVISSEYDNKYGQKLKFWTELEIKMLSTIVNEVVVTCVSKRTKIESDHSKMTD